jgi:hypothetical protein
MRKHAPQDTFLPVDGLVKLAVQVCVFRFKHSILDEPLLIPRQEEVHARTLAADQVTSCIESNGWSNVAAGQYLVEKRSRRSCCCLESGGCCCSCCCLESWSKQGGPCANTATIREVCNRSRCRRCSRYASHKRSASHGSHPITIGDASRAATSARARACGLPGRDGPTGAAGHSEEHTASALSRRPCLSVTCVQCENGKSISPIDSAQPTMAHDADTDSDLARPPDGKHPSAWHATPAMLLRSATRRHTAGHVVAHPGPSDSE